MRGVLVEVWSGGEVIAYGTYKQVAEKLGLSYSTVRKYTKGYTDKEYSVDGKELTFFDVTDEIEYTIYEEDDVLMAGTKEETKKEIGMTEGAFNMCLHYTRKGDKRFSGEHKAYWKSKYIYLTDERVY